MQLNFDGINDNKEDTLQAIESELRVNLIDTLLENDYTLQDDYFLYDVMDNLEISDLVTMHKQYDLLNQVIDLTSLDVKLDSWSYEPIRIELNDFADNMDSYISVLHKYLELLCNDTKSNAYKFLKFASANNWDIETSSLLGASWSIVHVNDDFCYELPDKLHNELVNVYLDFIETLKSMYEDSIVNIMHLEYNYYISSEYTLNYLDSLEIEELKELVSQYED
jgi:hypothetical protein